jgi:hypothetical protein
MDYRIYQNQRMHQIHCVTAFLKSGMELNLFEHPPHVLFGCGCLGIEGEFRKDTFGESGFGRFVVSSSSS